MLKQKSKLRQLLLWPNKKLKQLLKYLLKLRPKHCNKKKIELMLPHF